MGPRHIRARDVDHGTVREPQADALFSTRSVETDQLTLDPLAAVRQRIARLHRDFTPGEASIVRRTNQRPLHPGRGDLEHVPLGDLRLRIQPFLEPAADARTVVDRYAFTRPGARPIDANSQNRACTRSRALELDQLVAQCIDAPFDL